MDDATRPIMHHVITNKLATQYNWFSAFQGFLPSKDLKMYDAIGSEYFLALNTFLVLFHQVASLYRVVSTSLLPLDPLVTSITSCFPWLREEMYLNLFHARGLVSLWPKQFANPFVFEII